MNTPVLELRQITKGYGNFLALDHVDFSIQPGEIRALMGKNGAGKSTLVKLISGAARPDGGEMFCDGIVNAFNTPDDATAAGIATVHQELTIIPGLTVAENITLGHWPTRNGFLRSKDMRNTAAEALSLLGETMALDLPAGNLSIAKQQIVEIARALALKPKVLILDEPTSSLPANEVEALLSLIRRLSETGVSIIYVSHRMDEIARVAHSVTVLRDGKLIKTLAISEAPVDVIATLMVGENIEIGGRTAPKIAGEEILLDISELTAGPRVRSISMQIRKGEIIGIAGLLGSGRSELLRVLAGVDRPESGAIVLKGAPVHNATVIDMLARGVALVPEDRKDEGLVLGMPIMENLSMSSFRRFSKLGFMSSSEEKTLAEASRQLLSIKAYDLSLPVESLSGGNQQKVVIGRCLNAEIDVLLLDEPTRGVDVQAKQQIYELIRSLASQGKAIILVSSEYEELLLLSHRIVILADGHLIEELDPAGMGMDVLMSRLLAANDILKAQQAI